MQIAIQSMQLPNHCALQVTLLTLLKAYQTVLAEHGISEAEDAFYYRMLLSLSTAPGQDWWSKFESLKACSIRCSLLQGHNLHTPSKATER